MLFAMFYFNWVGVFGSVIAAALLIAGLTFVLRLMKVSSAPAWAVVCVAILGAIFAARGGGEIVVLMLLFGVPLLGSGIYLAGKHCSAKNIGIAASVAVFGVGLLFLLNTGHETRILREHEAFEISQANEAIMDHQAAIVRQLREKFDSQRRELFDARIEQADLATASESGERPVNDHVEMLKSTSGVAWYPEVDERFDVDIQPSMAATGRALGRKLVGLIDHSNEGKQEPPIIQIHASQTRIRNDSDDALNQLAAVMRSEYPDAKVLVDHLSTGNSVARLDPQAVSIQLKISIVRTRTPAPWSHSESEAIADISAELDTGAKKVSTSVRMIDKPWVGNFDEFVNSNQRLGIAIDGRSGRLATSAEDARKAAIDDAVNMLAPLATEVLKAQDRWLVQTPNEAEIAERLKKELQAGQLVVDRFTQQLGHPMGNFWREAVLVQVEYSWLERVFSNYLRERQQEQQDRLSLGAALALLIGGVIALHALLNWVTKGYHRKSVGVLSGLLAIGGVLMVLLIGVKMIV